MYFPGPPAILFWIKFGAPTGKCSSLLVSLFASRNFLVMLQQCDVTLSTNITNLPNLLCIFSRQAADVQLSNLSYCLNNCLPSIHQLPKTIVLLKNVLPYIECLSLETHFLSSNNILVYEDVFICARTDDPFYYLLNLFFSLNHTVFYKSFLWYYWTKAHLRNNRYICLIIFYL